MAKTRSPLHSIAASGTLAQAITYTTARGILATVKRHTTKRPPPSAAQLYVRNAMTEITAALRWINRTTYYNQTTGNTPRADWIAASPDPSDWQNHFQRLILGPAMATYAAHKAAWPVIPAPVRAEYQAEADQLAPIIKPTPQRDTTGNAEPPTASGEILYLIEAAAYIAGIRLTQPEIAPTLYRSTPPGAPGTIWDGGATIWDGGATTWDNP